MTLPPISETDTLEAALPARPLSKDVLEGSRIKTATDYGDDSEPNSADDEYARFYTANQARKAALHVKGKVNAEPANSLDGVASPSSATSETSSTSSTFVFDTSAGLEPLYGDADEDETLASYH